MRTKRLQLALVLFLIANQSMADALPSGTFAGTDATTQAYCERNRMNTTSAKNTQLERVIPKPANEYFSTSTCLDTILNTRINIFTLGSLDGILKQLMNMAVNRACGAVMGAWNQTVSDVNGAIGTSVNVPYVGNVGNVGVGTGFGGGPINVNGQSASVETVTGVLDTGGSSSVQPIANIYR